MDDETFPNGVVRPIKAYRNEDFINSRDARPLRILAEYLEPEARFRDQQIADTIVFQGSARTLPVDVATAALKDAEANGGDVEKARMDVTMARYYEDARELARRLTEWSKELKGNNRRFVICTGGGPGIMEAANRGASEAKGLNVGLTISIDTNEFPNEYITRQLALEFHYFFMRKYWFNYLAKAVVVMPGGFGTLDEIFELLTLIQTGKIKKPLPTILFGTEYWDSVINFDALARYGTIDPADLDIFHRTDSVDDAFEYLVTELTRHGLVEPGPTL